MRSRYPEYKPSGVEWLGDIPTHWETKRLKHVARLRSGNFITSSDIDVSGDYPVYGGNGFRGFTSTYTHEGDFALIGRQGALCGCINYARGKFWASEHAVVVTPINETVTPWVGEVLRSMNLNQYSQSAAQPGLAVETIAALLLPVPPAREQWYIAKFLYRETAHIARLIEKKQRQIELLQEKRAALITHAVTKGLNPDARMKDSGIEWLGEVPEHWQLHRAKGLFQQIDERSTTGEEELLTVSHITGVTRRSVKNVNMFMAESLEGYKKCETDDLVINTMWAWMGAIGIAPEAGIVSPSYNVYRLCNDTCEACFYDHLFRTGRFLAEVICHSKGIWSSRLRLYPEEFFEIRIPCPPLDEQREIVAAIRNETGHYDALQQKVEQSIEKLHEYRSALISAAVTGKIDVRGEPTRRADHAA